MDPHWFGVFTVNKNSRQIAPAISLLSRASNISD